MYKPGTFIRNLAEGAPDGRMGRPNARPALFGDANDDKLFVAGMVPLSNFGPARPSRVPGASFFAYPASLICCQSVGPMPSAKLCASVYRWSDQLLDLPRSIRGFLFVRLRCSPRACVYESWPPPPHILVCSIKPSASARLWKGDAMALTGFVEASLG